MATQHAIQIDVITPERRVLSEEVHAIVIPAHDGEIGILPGRAPLMCELGIGTLRFRNRDGKQQRVFLDGGFAQVIDNRVSVLCEFALRSDEVTADRISEAEQNLAAIDGHTIADNDARVRAQQRVTLLRELQSRN